MPLLTPSWPFNLLQPDNVGSGIQDKILIAPLSWFSVLQMPDSDGGVTISLTHEFITPLQGFIEVMLSPGKNSFTAKTIGELLGQQFSFEIKVFVPGSYVEAHESIKNLLNTPQIVLVKDCKQVFQIGCSCSPAYMKPEFTTGTTSSGVKGYEITLTSIGSNVVLYSGDITLVSPYPNHGVPLFITDTLITPTLSNMRDSYAGAISRNMTAIYNAVRDRAEDSTVQLAYADDGGVTGIAAIEDIDVSSFSAFAAAITVLAGGYAATTELYGTSLLIEKAGDEHYLGIILLDGSGTGIITEDGDDITTEDGTDIIIE